MRISEEFAIVPVAFSTNGRQVGFVGPLDAGIAVGGIAIVELDDGHIAVHVHDVHLETWQGTRAIEAGDDDISVGFAMRHVSGNGVVIGMLGPDGFTVVDDHHPFGERPVRAATDDEVGQVMATLDGDATTIEIGALRGFPALPARLRSKGFARHTFMCGQSGSGKTYTTGVLFERLLAYSSLPMLIIDPNSDHINLGALADPDHTSPESERYRHVAPSVVVSRTRGLPSTVTLCVDFSDLDLVVQAALLRLDPIADLDDYAALRAVTERLDVPYSITDVAHLAAQDPASSPISRRIQNLGIDRWSLWRTDSEQSVTRLDLLDRRCVVVDTGSLAGPDERAAVSMAILGNRWNNRRDRRPVLLAIDEAHNVLPSSTENPLLRRATQTGILIAGEGRKFGLHLFLASQRPAKVHPGVLSQCDNLVLMRMNGAGDVADLEAVFSHVPPMMLRESLGFGLGQALFAGPLAPFPVFAQVGTRLTPEGGGDLPTTWTAEPAPAS
jgi:DNA helicase HerA-like ATPase